MSSIGPGDLVECVDDVFSHRHSKDVLPVRRHVYTVASVHAGCPVCGCGAGYIGLLELQSPLERVCLCGHVENNLRHFSARRFRPIDHHPEFTEWLETLPERETVDG